MTTAAPTASSSEPRRVAVVGPTASGKSGVAFAAAIELGDAELISVDAMQVYRGMDIGTAKPPAEERAAVRHHLIDLVDHAEEFTVAQFKRAHDEALDDIAARGRRAVLVGGTGLYHRIVIDGIELPGDWPELRRRFEEEAADLGAEALHGRLAELDPAAAARMERTNTRRVVRALEVCVGSGRPFSSFGPGLDTYPPSPVPQIGLRWPRDVLGRRVEQRVHQMLEDGLLDEVRALRGSGLSRTARQALGYKELLDHLDGGASLDEAVETIIRRTRQFAVRQLRWFGRDPRVRWIDITHDPVEEARAIVVDALS